MRKAKLGRTLSEEHKKNIGLARKGTSISEEHKKRISKANMKLANVYNYKTNELIASSVCLSHWCENTIYSRKHLSATARYDKTKPTSDSNRRQHKGLYAVYI